MRCVKKNQYLANFFTIDNEGICFFYEISPTSFSSSDLSHMAIGIHQIYIYAVLIKPRTLTTNKTPNMSLLFF
jgi:mannitol-specific phosphotransferase system IIBC component